jgi:hypothetical protein
MGAIPIKEIINLAPEQVQERINHLATPNPLLSPGAGSATQSPLQAPIGEPAQNPLNKPIGGSTIFRIIR